MENDAAMVKSHIVALTNLSKDTRYFFRVGSIDNLGNGPDSSPEFLFTTNSVADTFSPRITVPPTVTSITDSTAIIGWETDEPSNSMIQYGTIP